MPRRERHSLTLEPPKGLEGASITLGDETFVVLSFPLLSKGKPATLTRSEAAVVELVLSGLRTKAIAAARGVSERTVANQLQSAYSKLGVTTRAELALLLR